MKSMGADSTTHAQQLYEKHRRVLLLAMGTGVSFESKSGRASSHNVVQDYIVQKVSQRHNFIGSCSWPYGGRSE